MSRKFERRLAVLEQRLKATAPGTMEIVVHGGLGPGVAPIASFSGREWEAAPDESFEAFRARAKAAAEAERARFIIFGGLPNVSPVPADSETQATREQLAASTPPHRQRSAGVMSSGGQTSDAADILPFLTASKSSGDPASWAFAASRIVRS
jgi:hypothetical protein